MSFLESSSRWSSRSSTLLTGEFAFVTSTGFGINLDEYFAKLISFQEIVSDAKKQTTYVAFGKNHKSVIFTTSYH